MKRIFIIEPFHSLIDVITNSSTELFIADTDKSVNAVWEFLGELGKLLGYEENCGVGDVYVINEYNIKQFWEYYRYYLNVSEDLCSWTFSEKYFKERNWEFKNSSDPIIAEEFRKRRFEADEAYETHVEKYWGNHKHEMDSYIGKIVIVGANDNSIPYEIWDILDNTFNAEHFHLG